MFYSQKHKIYIFVVIGIVIILSFIIMSKWQRPKGSTLLSWKIGKETEQTINKYRKQLEIDRMFQYIKPNEYSNGSLDAYLLEMKRRDLEVYAMDGGYYWGTTDYGYEELIGFVDQVYEYNLSHDHKLKGIVLDVEPAQDEEWEYAEDILMERYVTSMCKAYEYARNKDLEVAVCVTNWYDEMHEKELRRLIEHGCDEIAVMNYYYGKEIDLIETEVSMAKEYHKPIISIFEFAKPDNKGIFEQNTYYNKGVHSARETFREMDEFYDYKGLTAGWHQLN